jgi:hypothetical protein
VVGLYGDPEVSWGIGVELDFTGAIGHDTVAADARLAELASGHRHLGRPAVVEVVARRRWRQRVAEMVFAPFQVSDPLVRVLVTEDLRSLAVGAHHGVVDGLGLLAIAQAVSDRHIDTAARGIGALGSRRSFVWSSVARVAEAVVAPPARFVGSGRVSSSSSPDILMRLVRTPVRVRTAQLAYAVAGCFREWRDTREVSGRRPVLSLGASRRCPGALQPDRQTAYMRLPFDPDWPPARFADQIGRLTPEPSFPETSVGGAAPKVTRVLRRRLGATAALANLGLVSGPALESVAMYPVPAGPSAVAVGLASTVLATTVTVRAKAADFSSDDVEALLGGIASRLAPTR